MLNKSNKDLVLEMILSHKDYVASRIENSSNAKTYVNTMTFIYHLLDRPWTFEDLRSQMYWFNRDSDLLENNNKYYALAIEHCLNIVESINQRFANGIENDL